jgi:hypothetical protein
MLLKKSILALPALFLLLAGCEMTSKPQCKTREACLNDPDCMCWCSVECSYRKKNASDRPIYVENDPNGKYCYCKQWDYDHYQDCKNGKK